MENNIIIKKCAECLENKHIDNFGKVCVNDNGTICRRKLCKICYAIIRRRIYKENKEKILSQNKKWSLKNKQRKKEMDKIYYENNKERILADQKTPEKRLRNCNNKKIWAEKNKEKIKLYPSYKKKKEYHKKSLQKGLKNNPFLKLRMYVSRNIYKMLKRNKASKSGLSCLQFLPYSIQELRSYVEGKFEDWMNWENYGKYNGEFNYGWDIDHIIPLSSAKSEEDIIKLNHYENLQPLCSKVNRDIKSDRMDL